MSDTAKLPVQLNSLGDSPQVQPALLRARGRQRIALSYFRPSSPRHPRRRVGAHGESVLDSLFALNRALEASAEIAAPGPESHEPVGVTGRN